MKSQSQGRDFVGSSRVHRKSGRSLEVLAEPTEKSRSLPKKLVRTRQEDHREVQELAESPPKYYREIVGSSSEEQTQELVQLSKCLRISQLSRNWAWIWANPIKGQLGPCKNCVGPNKRPKQCPKKSHHHGIVFETMSSGGTASLGDGTTQHCPPGGGTAQGSVSLTNTRRWYSPCPGNLG